MMVRSKILMVVVASLLTGCPRGLEVHLRNSSDDELSLERYGSEKLIEPSEIVVVPEGRSSGLPLGTDGVEQLRLRDSMGIRYCFRLIFSHVPDAYFGDESTQKIRLEYLENGIVLIEPYNKQAVRQKGGLTLPACD